MTSTGYLDANCPKCGKHNIVGHVCVDINEIGKE